MNIERLKQLMREHDMNQTELARVAGVSHAFVTYMLKGYKTPSLEVTKRIAHYFGVTIDELAG